MCIADTLFRSPIEGQNSTTDNEVETFVDGVVSSISVTKRNQSTYIN